MIRSNHIEILIEIISALEGEGFAAVIKGDEVCVERLACACQSEDGFMGSKRSLPRFKDLNNFEVLIDVRKYCRRSWEHVAVDHLPDLEGKAPKRACLFRWEGVKKRFAFGLWLRHLEEIEESDIK
jgi:hypothetical protein